MILTFLPLTFYCGPWFRFLLLLSLFFSTFFSYYLSALQTFFTLPRGSSSSQQIPFFQKTNMFISLTTPQQHLKIRPNLYPMCDSSFPIPPRVGILERSDRQGAAGTTNSQDNNHNSRFLVCVKLQLPPAKCKSNKFSTPCCHLSWEISGKFISAAQTSQLNNQVKQAQTPSCCLAAPCLLSLFNLFFPSFGLSPFSLLIHFFSSPCFPSHLLYFPFAFLSPSLGFSYHLFCMPCSSPRPLLPGALPPAPVSPWLSVTCYSSKSVESQWECALCPGRFLFLHSMANLSLFQKERG